MEALVKEVSDFYVDTKSKKVRMNTIILEKQTELAKVTLRKETPLIQVIDRPILPLAKEKFGKAKGIVLGGFLASLSYTKQKTSLVQDDVVENVTENVTEDVIEDVTDNRRNAIVELIKKDHKITTTEIANAMGVVRRTIARDIELLKRSGVIVRVGSDKHGYWEAVDRKEP